jgi:hypothetical protein
MKYQFFTYGKQFKLKNCTGKKTWGEKLNKNDYNSSGGGARTFLFMI